MIFEQWDVILARFPFVERLRQKTRPVAILSSVEYNRSHPLVMAVMITSASEGSWSSDSEVLDLSSAGLKRRCFVRWKFATLSTSLVDRRLGTLAEVDRQRLRRQLTTIIPLEGTN